MGIKKIYNFKEADRTFNNYKEYSGFDPIELSQKTESVYFRALLYKVLTDLNLLNTRQVAEFMEIKGKKTHRVSVFHAIKKVDIYYRDFPEFREIYNLYFDDKLEEFNKIEEKRKLRLNEVENKMRAVNLQRKLSPLELLISSIPLDRRQEIFDLVNMRVKSWGWKSKKVIN
tara:strand:- start:647 stop:1162 length:516 start_codon:yes stop_codon:yes gene_type:complete